jgi:hypothetical protein
VIVPAPPGGASSSPAPGKKKPSAKTATGATPASATPPAPPPAPPATTAPAPPPPPAKTAPAELPNVPRDAAPDNGDTREDPGRKYYFVGLRYRGTIIPQAFENIFVDDGATIFSNTIGAEFDIRSNGNSMIPWIQYTDYNTGDILFLQKGQPNNAANRSVVNSSLKALYLGLDEYWSVPIVPAKVDFEFGFGVGVGAIFGNLNNDWVYADPKGPLYAASNGMHYSKCTSTSAPIADQSPTSDGCDPGNHASSKPVKVGSYVEPNWFNGGSVPVIFPHISIPQIGVRIKPIKQLVIRVDVGLSLTGVWFGTSVDYGLEKTSDSEGPKAGASTRLHDTL